MHQSLSGSGLKRTVVLISYHLIWFMFSFPLRLFVCSHDFGCCLSSGGMYTCSSPTLVHLSALRCFWWSAMLLFCFSFNYIQNRVVFVFVSSSTREFQMFVSCVSSNLEVLSLLGGQRVNLSPFGLDSGCCCFVTTLLSTVFVLCMLWWSLSLIFFFFDKLHYAFFPFSEHNKELFRIDQNQPTIGELLFAFWKR